MTQQSGEMEMEHSLRMSPSKGAHTILSFEFGEENSNVFAYLKDDNGSDSGINFDYNDPDMPNNIDVDPDVSTYPDEIIAATPKSTHGTHDGIDTHESLDDDLCWLHLTPIWYEMQKYS
ncbi:hypothetical protein Zm00014a_017445 [Zea mays]|uniref:Uncharacterized protein n=1 Tax=Zea mays TaxID=4577 RepID=A0A317Y6N5_MAIZE|nr:hypothetical protein Zm00014a_017445 [Zea mays]